MERALAEFSARHPWLTDAAWMTPVALTCVFTAGKNVAPPGIAAELALSAGQLVPLLWRRRFPVIVFAVAAGVTLVQVVMGWPVLVANVGGCVALFTVAGRCSLVRSLAAMAVAMAVTLAWIARYPATMMEPEVATMVGAVVTLWLGGRFTLARRRATAALRESLILAEEARTREARYAVARERLQLASALHDTVAHNVSVMLLQAEGVRRQPALAGQAMDVIIEAGRAALADMRCLVGALGEEQEPIPWSKLTMDAVEAVERSGLHVQVSVVGQGEEERWAGVYGVVREALTNALKYAGPGAHVRVRIAFCSEGTRVGVEDDGDGTPVPMPSSGHGLAGLQRQVIAAGGDFAAGPGWTRGYRVSASFPAVAPALALSEESHG